jgi:predicted DCC family thiol-disulfide oxidoreductase YuxK
MHSLNPKHIVFFDGVCHLCNGFVDQLITRDGQKKFLFAPLQGETAKRELPRQDLQNLDTVIVKKNNGELLFRSEAVLFCLSEIGGPWGAMRFFKIIPRGLRDRIYSLVAKNRNSWFGQRDSCRLPLSHERPYLLP